MAVSRALPSLLSRGPPERARADGGARWCARRGDIIGDIVGVGVARLARTSVARLGEREPETRRFGIGRGSSATYRENAPTTYEDGVADELAIALFNAKLDAVVGEGDEEERALRGFDRLVALSEKLAEGRDPEEQRDAVTGALPSIIPAPVRFLFKSSSRRRRGWTR